MSWCACLWVEEKCQDLISQVKIMCLAFLILLLSKAISFHGLKLFFSTHELTIHRILTPHKVYERLHTVYSRGWIYEPCDEGETRTERDNLYKEKKKKGRTGRITRHFCNSSDPKSVSESSGVYDRWYVWGVVARAEELLRGPICALSRNSVCGPEAGNGPGRPFPWMGSRPNQAQPVSVASPNEFPRRKRVQDAAL